ncbi:MAG: CvpA family protein [Bacteroidales bacterium]|nr:CvpA family protein [Bacteroidales bacterium]
MNYLDIIIAIILILFAIGGFRNGIIREAFSLVAFLGGIYGALKLSAWAGQGIGKVIDVSPEWMSVISFMVVFIGLAIIINWLGNLLARLIDSLNLGFIDKIGGIVFGIAKGFLLVGVLILLLDYLGIKDVLKEDVRKNSVLYSNSEKVATWMYENKDGWLKQFEEGYEKIEEKVEDLI